MALRTQPLCAREPRLLETGNCGFKQLIFALGFQSLALHELLVTFEIFSAVLPLPDLCFRILELFVHLCLVSDGLPASILQLSYSLIFDTVSMLGLLRQFLHEFLQVSLLPLHVHSEAFHVIVFLLG
jgi:hypothetical protein